LLLLISYVCGGFLCGAILCVGHSQENAIVVKVVALRCQHQQVAQPILPATNWTQKTLYGLSL